MTQHYNATGEARESYRRELYSDRMRRSLRSACVITIALMGAFVILDALRYPQQLRSLIAVRSSLSVVLATLAFRTSNRHPLAAGIIGTSLCSATLLWLIHAAGGPGSNYDSGLFILLAGVPLLLPFSPLHTGMIIGSSLAAYLLMPMLPGARPDWDAISLHSFFLLSAGVLSVLSAILLDRARFAEFCRRSEVERSRDQLLELDRAKSRFIANVHHELRTPLTLLLAPIEAMLAGEFGALAMSQIKPLESMYANAARLLQLINCVLDLARSEAGHLRLQRRATRVGVLAASIIEAAGPLAHRKGVVLEGMGLDELPLAQLDPDALQRVLVNLIGNALKFTERGGRVEVRGKCAEDLIELVVADTGIGIPPKQIDRIFERFVQLDDSPTRRFEGTGIGLAIARELVEEHGGTLWAESAGPGCGAAFHVGLPRNAAVIQGDEATCGEQFACEEDLRRSFAALEAKLDLPTASDSWENAQPTSGTSNQAAPFAPEVLIVEDNSGMRRLLARILQPEFRVRTVADGTQALTAIAARVPDIVLADVMMPSLSGVDLCRRLKRSDETRGVPVILLTARGDESSRFDGLESGAEDYLTKPFHVRELLARVRALVRLRQLQRDLASRNSELESSNRALANSQRNLTLYSRTVSHDLRSPLAAAAEALRMAGECDRRDREMLVALARENIERADRMLVALRGLTLAVGHAEVAAWIPLRDVIAEVVAELTMAGGIESVRIEVADDLGDLWAPRDHVSHVVRNLLRNAVQALNGRVDSRIEVGRVPGKSYSFFVRDNGPGVPYEEQTRIFEAFRRGPRSGPNNMGLGLALVQQLVEQNGGEVWVNSAPGEGATFCVALPPPPAAPESTVAPADRTVSACQLPRGTEDSTKSRERIHRSASMIQGRSASDSETDLGAKVEGMIA